MSLPDPWPLRHLVVRTPRLELYPNDDAGLLELAHVAAQGVHPPEQMPMGSPWTDAPSDEIGRNMLQSFWGSRSDLASTDWKLQFLIRYNGAVVGTQLLYARHFAITREVGSGSWLGMAFQGQGIGTEVRIAVLTLAFDHLGAIQARSTAWDDNHASLRVSSKLGYRRDGTTREVRRSEAATGVRLLLTRDDFLAHRPEWPVTVDGLAPCLASLGAATSIEADAD